MFFLISLNILFSFLFSNCLTRTLEDNHENVVVKPISNISSIHKSNNTLNDSHLMTPYNSENSAIERKEPQNLSDIYKKDIERLNEKIKELTKEKKQKLSSEKILDKILEMILENKDLELKKCKPDVNDPNDLRNSNLQQVIKKIGLGLDYYDSSEYVEPQKLPVSLETPKNGVLGKLYFNFDPINNSGRPDKTRTYEKTSRNGVPGKKHFNYIPIDDSQYRK